MNRISQAILIVFFLYLSVQFLPMVMRSEGLALSNFSDNSFSATDIHKLSEEWTYPIQGAYSSKDELGGVFSDSKGDVFLGGPFLNTVSFDGVSRRAKAQSDIFVAKLDSNGNELWFKQFDSGGDDYLWGMTTDSQDDVLISGGYGGGFTVKGISYSAAENGSAYFAKLDGETGELKWFLPAGVQGLVGPINPEVTARGGEIAVDSNNNLIATMAASGSLYKVGGSYYQKQGVSDSFISKISPGGAVTWSLPFGGGGLKKLEAVGVSAFDEIIFGLQYDGDLLIEGEKVHGGKNKDISQAVVGLLTSEGEYKWSIGVSSEGTSSVSGVGGDDVGNIYFTGKVFGEFEIGENTFSEFRQGGTYLAKYTSDGEMVWVRLMGNKYEDNGGELVVGDKMVAVTGANKSENYHLHDEKGGLIKENIHATPSNKNGATITIFDLEGDLLAVGGPSKTDASDGGVLEFLGSDCLVYGLSTYGEIEFSNDDTYLSINAKNPSVPDRDSVLVKACF